MNYERVGIWKGQWAKIQPSRSGLYPVGTPPGVETPGYYRMSLPGRGREHGAATGVRCDRGRNPGRRALEKPLKRIRIANPV